MEVQLGVRHLSSGDNPEGCHPHRAGKVDLMHGGRGAPFGAMMLLECLCKEELHPMTRGPGACDGSRTRACEGPRSGVRVRRLRDSSSTLSGHRASPTLKRWQGSRHHGQLVSWWIPPRRMCARSPRCRAKTSTTGKRHERGRVGAMAPPGEPCRPGRRGAPGRCCVACMDRCVFGSRG